MDYTLHPYSPSKNISGRRTLPYFSSNARPQTFPLEARLPSDPWLATAERGNSVSVTILDEESW